MLAKKYDYDYAWESPAVPKAPQPKKEERKARPKVQTRLNSGLRSRVFGMVLLLAAGAAALTFFSSMNASRGYALVQMQNETKQLEMENRQLQLEISKLKSPQRIKDIATKDLGMSVPEEVYFASER